jgi:hypothetical protein
MSLLKGLLADPIADIVCEYATVQYTNKKREWLQNLIRRLENDFAKPSTTARCHATRMLLFLDLLSSPTTWADFSLLEVMSVDDYSVKRLCYTAAGQLWNAASDVVLMSTSRIQRDLTCSKPLVVASVLSSLPPFLSPVLASSISNDVIRLMTSSKPFIQVKAITVFYHICLCYPDALRPGYPTLRALIDDSSKSIVMASLNVLHELCITNPAHFVQMIPKFFKMLDQELGSWITIKVIQILTVLATAEPRLQKKLIGPFSNLIETDSLALLLEICRAIVQIPISNTSLVGIAIAKIEPQLRDPNETVRSLFLCLFMAFLKLQPKLCSQYRDLVTDCLDAEDETQQFLALDLLGSMANAKTIEQVVSLLFAHFQKSISIRARNEMFATVIRICQADDYAFVGDFAWYVQVLLDFIQASGFTCFDVLASQFIDLFYRVPGTRAKLVAQIPAIFDANFSYVDAMPFLIASAHVIGRQGSRKIEKIFPNLADCQERVQQAFLNAAIRCFLNAPTKQLLEKIEAFKGSRFPSVQNDALMYRALAEVAAQEEVRTDLLGFFEKRGEKAEEELTVPAELSELIGLFSEGDDEKTVAPKQEMVGRKVGKRLRRRQTEPSERAAVRRLSSQLGDDAKSGVLSDQLASVELDLPSDRTVLAQNSVWRISLVDVTPIGQTIQFELIVSNLSKSKLRGFEIEGFQGRSAPIKARQSVTHKLSIDSENPEIEQPRRIVFTPIGIGAPLEVSFQLKTSMFLQPAAAASFDVEQCQAVQQVSVKANATPEKCVRSLQKLIRSGMVRNKATRNIEFYTKASYGPVALVLFKWEAAAAVVTVKAQSGGLATALVNEIETELKAL